MSAVVLLAIVAVGVSKPEVSPVQAKVRVEAVLKDEDPSVDGIRTLAVERSPAFSLVLAPDMRRRGGGGAICSVRDDRRLTDCRLHDLAPSSEGMTRVYHDALSRIRVAKASYAGVRGRLISVAVTFETIVDRAPEGREAVCNPPFCTSEGGAPPPPPPPSTVPK
jgi:hypothetical protein